MLASFLVWNSIMNLFKNLGYDYIVNIKSILWLLVSLDGLQFSSCFGTEHETVLLLFPQEYLNQGCGSGFRFIGSESDPPEEDKILNRPL